MFQHNPTLSIANVASGFTTTSSTVTTQTTAVEVPAGSIVAVTCQAFSASVGTCTLTASAGGFGTQTYPAFDTIGTSGSQSLLVFQVPNTMPVGTTLTYTRASGNWPSAELRMILCRGVTRLANKITRTDTAVPINTIRVLDGYFDQGVVNVSHHVKSHIAIVLMASNINQSVLAIGGLNHNPNFTAASQISVGGGAGTTTANSGFRYVVATAIFPLGSSITLPRFAYQTIAPSGVTQDWIVSYYRLTPG